MRKHHNNHKGVDAKVGKIIEDETPALQKIDKNAFIPNGSDPSAHSPAEYVPPKPAAGSTDALLDGSLKSKTGAKEADYSFG